MAYSKITSRHDDMLGRIQSAVTGGTAWNYPVTLTNTPFVGGALRNNSSDMVQVSIQVPHRRLLNTNLDSIHIHLGLQTNSTLNQTIVFTGRYVWVNPNTTIPSTASWTAMSGAGLTLNLGAAKTAPYYLIHSVETNIAFPVSEGYGGMLLIEITRGNGTYTGEIFIFDVDAHSLMRSEGSVLEYTDA